MMNDFEAGAYIGLVIGIIVAIAVFAIFYEMKKYKPILL